jgi:hypothetical protein
MSENELKFDATRLQLSWGAPNNPERGDGWVDTSKDPAVPYIYDGEKWITCSELIEKKTTQESLQVQYELPEWYKKQLEANEEEVRKSAEIIREGADRVRNLMGLKIWLIEQIEKETDETRLRTLKRMLEGVEV